MSSHCIISFNEVVEGAANHTKERFSDLANKAKTFIKHQITNHLRFYRQLNTYEGIPTTPFWQGMLPESNQLRAPGSEFLTLPKIDQASGASQKTEQQQITPQQQLVLNRLKDIASKQGYEIRLLPSPSKDLVIDMLSFDIQDAVPSQRNKVLVRRR